MNPETRQAGGDHSPGPKAPARDPAVSVLDLVAMRVRIRARRRALWLQHLRGESGTDRATTHFDDRDTPLAEHEWYQSADAVAAENRGIEHVEKLLAGPAGERFRRLETMFCLQPHESDLLQTCLALVADPHLGPVFAALEDQPARCYATDSLAARLFGLGRRSLWHAASPLSIWRLIRALDAPAGEGVPLVCDAHIVHWLQGDLHVDPTLVGAVREVEHRTPLASWPLEETVQLIRRSMEREVGVRIILEGPTGSGRRTLAAGVAARFGVPTLAVDHDRIPDETWPECFMRAQRLAILGNMALVWHGAGRRWPAQVGTAPLQFVACDEAQIVPAEPAFIDHRVVMPGTSLEERSALWARHIPESASWPAAEREALVSRHRLVVGDIVALGRRCPASPREASVLCREMTRDRLGDFGRLLDCTFGWDDLVVPQRLRTALEDFAFEAVERGAFWESEAARRLFPRGTGLVALLSGPPGTGKTMAAQIIAAELELDLFRIDLATVVSKYIGETIKNLSRIFSRAARMNAILLFDEADAIFSRRTEVRDSHDRYANTDTNYLLQLLEEYRGIALLATNKKNNIDPAFTRRVRYVMRFPRPDAIHRQRIWQRLINELCGADSARRLGRTIESVAAEIEASGAQIKNAVLAALFIARRSRRRLGPEHLLQGLERELGKEGRSLGNLELEVASHA